MRNLFNEIRKERLTAEEKSEMLSGLRAYMAKNPAQKIPSPFYSSSSFFRSKVFITTSSLVVVFATTFGTASASSRSLPGDILYPVKILGENVQSFVAIGAKAQARVQTEHAIARLKETEELANTGRLDAATRKEIEHKFETQTTEVLKHIDELKNEGHDSDALTANADFEARLREHQKTIAEIRDDHKTKDETRDELDNVSLNVNSQLEKTSKIHREEKKKEDVSGDEQERAATQGEVVDSKIRTEVIETRVGEGEVEIRSKVESKSVEDPQKKEDEHTDRTETERKR